MAACGLNGNAQRSGEGRDADRSPPRPPKPPSAPPRRERDPDAALVSEISASSQEQSTGLNEVNTALNQMDQMTQQNAAMVEQTTAAAHSLRSEPGRLAELVGQFNLEPAARSARAA